MKSYKQIFFDLDRTLWDFSKNSSESLIDVVEKFSLNKVIKNKEEFIAKYNYYNDQLWDLLKAGKIKKRALRHERFRLLLEDYELTDEKLIQQISRFYLNSTPLKTSVIPGAHETIKYLSAKYQLHIISNGFYDVQLTKMISSGLKPYFNKIFTSDIVGHAKPQPEIFNYAISSVNVKKIETLMVGDDPVNDIQGAQQAKIDQAYLNPENKNCPVTPTYQIRELSELMNIL